MHRVGPIATPKNMKSTTRKKAILGQCEKATEFLNSPPELEKINFCF